RISPDSGVTRFVHFLKSSSLRWADWLRSRAPLFKLEILRKYGPFSSFFGVACGPSKTSATSPMHTMESDVIPQPPKIPLDLSFQPVTLSKLLPQLSGQSRHLLGKRLSIVFLLLSTHVTPRCQHKIVLPDLVQTGGFAETGDIFIAFAPLPGMEGVGDFGDIVLAEVPQHPIPHT